MAAIKIPSLPSYFYALEYNMITSIPFALKQVRKTNKCVAKNWPPMIFRDILRLVSQCLRETVTYRDTTHLKIIPVQCRNKINGIQ